MQGEMVIYNGRAVPKHNFRAFVFNTIGEKKLMDSYAEYEEHITSGVWYPTKELAETLKKKRKKGGE